ncbi:MAG: ATPase [Bacteroidetes bacterium]|nr:ATPase [Bacteroidota bacterium]
MNYNYPHLLKYLEHEGKKKFGPQFRFHQKDFHVLKKLMYYFTANQEKAKEHNIDLKKGIMLSGPVGCGKTTILTLMKLLSDHHKFLFIPSREVSLEFIQDGYEVIHRYTKGIPNAYTKRHIGFDDLGTERTLKYFGNECNVMAEILLSRYDMFVNNGFMTHITTNLSAHELEDYYGNRVRSRLRAMCNLIAFDKDTEDKR